ncbi:hypothetical protein [Pararhodobacter zhoushanensis]|uniref:Uncharacterized protein n=1 Tax=Pararhodobacter zhoushanensis TaxID=2479545 RepID=A0ABT3H1U1_9RHOB|nr:hypothetical protein [Pararhodobacter zhoushanensis]MCW1933752.1 hypothetical protein [Pararhodobacter zhoushanensis]
MTLARVLFVVLSVLSFGGAGYLGYRGIGGVSADLDRSIRVGSGGNSFYNSNVK